MTYQSRLDEEKWKEYIKDLKEFKEKHGHCKVPQKFPRLGQWVHHVRCAQKALQQGKPYSLKLTPDRIQELEAIGFVWGESRPGWNDHIEDLRNFQQQHGHTLVPANFPENTGLSKWVRRVRVAYSLMQQGKFKKGATIKLTPERISQLKAMGFVWNTKNKNPPEVTIAGNGNAGFVDHHHHHHDLLNGGSQEFAADGGDGSDTVAHRISQGYHGAARARAQKRRRTEPTAASSKLCPEGVRIQQQLKEAESRNAQLSSRNADLESKLKEQQEVAEYRRIQNEGLWDENEKLRREIADLKAGRLVFQHWNR
jgi:cell division protein FtsB